MNRGIRLLGRRQHTGLCCSLAEFAIGCVALAAWIAARPCIALEKGVTKVIETQAQAAQTMIVLGVQQGISSLPPTSAQSFFYQFDYESEVFVPSDRLGPTVLRSPELLRAGDLNLRVGASYF